jgi:hypothetical protein
VVDWVVGSEFRPWENVDRSGFLWDSCASLFGEPARDVQWEGRLGKDHIRECPLGIVKAEGGGHCKRSRFLRQWDSGKKLLSYVRTRVVFEDCVWVFGTVQRTDKLLFGR